MLGGRERLFGHQIEFVAEVDEGIAEFLFGLFLPAGDLGDGFGCQFRADGIKFGKALTMGAETHRYDGQRLDSSTDRPIIILYLFEFRNFLGSIVTVTTIANSRERAFVIFGGDSQCQKITEGLFKDRTFIPTRTQNNLGVDLDTGLCEFTQDFHHVESALDAQHARADVDIRGVYRNVERAHLLLDDPFQPPLSQAGQGDVISVKETEPVVLILHIDLVPHSLRILVDETEYAVAGAGLEFHGRETAGHRVDVRWVHFHEQCFTGLSLDVQRGDVGFGCVVVEVEDVLDGPAVEVRDVVAGLPLEKSVQRRWEWSDEHYHVAKVNTTWGWAQCLR